MVRPRFAKLPVEQQEAILSAARDEFAAHGFHDASLNRVIDAAAISKGSMYYYFDGKEDLYAHVARVELERLVARTGTFELRDATTPDAFWSGLDRYYLELMSALEGNAQLAAILRGWIAVSATPAMQRAQQEVLAEIGPWMEAALDAGQRVGAIRTDLPAGLLIAVAAGMGQAMDMWLLAQPADAGATPGLISSLIGMIRRALEP